MLLIVTNIYKRCTDKYRDLKFLEIVIDDKLERRKNFRLSSVYQLDHFWIPSTTGNFIHKYVLAVSSRCMRTFKIWVVEVGCL